MNDNNFDNFRIPQQYLKSIKRFPNLTQEEEYLLFTQYRNEENETNKKSQEDYLIGCYLLYSYKLASKFDGYNIPIDDLISAASIGLTLAARQFDPTRDVKFQTYAYYLIKKHLWYCVLNEMSNVKIPENVWLRINKINKAEAILCQELGSPPSIADIANKLNWNEKKVRETQKYMFRYVSLEQPFNQTEEDMDDCGEYIQVEQTIDENDPESILIEREEEEERLSLVKKAMSLLNPQERKVIGFYYKLPDAPRNINELESYGIKPHRLKHIKSTALQKMKTLKNN